MRSGPRGPENVRLLAARDVLELLDEILGETAAAHSHSEIRDKRRVVTSDRVALEPDVTED